MNNNSGLNDNNYYVNFQNSPYEAGNLHNNNVLNFKPLTKPQNLIVDLNLFNKGGNKVNNNNNDSGEEPQEIESKDKNEGGGDEPIILYEEYWTELINLIKEGNQLEAKAKESGSKMLIKTPTCPFFQRNHFSLYDIIKIAFGTVFIFPLRVLVLLTLITIGWSLSHLATAFLSFEETQAKPLSRWRRFLRWFIANCIMRPFAFCAGFYNVKTKGVQVSPEEASILVVGPHSSYIDALPLVMCGAPSVIARAETRHGMFTGKMLELVQAVFLSRESQHSRASTVKVIQDRVDKILNTDEPWPQLYIYPEGTCSNRSCIISFKSGAFIPGVPVQPVLIKYPNRMDHITWTFDGPGVIKSLWLTLVQFSNKCEIEFLPVYTPNEDEKCDCNLFANNVREVMAKALGVPISDYVYNDGLAIYNLNMDKIVNKLKGISEFRKNNNVSSLVEIDVMREIINNGTGANVLITKQNFLEKLKLNNKHYYVFVNKLFRLLEQKDEDHRQIDHREYLIYASILNPYLEVHLVIPLYFLMYTRGHRKMSLQAFNQFTSAIFYMSESDSLQIFNVGHPSSSSAANDPITLEIFTKKLQKRLEYIKLHALEVLGLLKEYPLREIEINNCKRRLQKKSD